jgi:prepilin-type N-terminal cleavage/methylation domain-containing protein
MHHQEGGNQEMNHRLLLRQLKKAARDQRGFTLIELLVVISILGILAAVVTMSMVGITKIAQDRAAATEKQTVQTVYDTMLADQGVPSGSECVGATTGGATGVPGSGTNNMSSFANQAWSSQPQHIPVALYPHYLRQQTTHGDYHCYVDPATGVGGTIVQDDYKP